MSETRQEPLLKVEHLRQYFNKGNSRAVDDISFNVWRGEVFSLVGESGCGKTTTGRSVIGLHNITGGQVYFDGQLVNAGLYDCESALQQAARDVKEKKISAGDYRQIVRQQRQEERRIRQFLRKRDFETKIQMIYQDPATSLDPRMTVREIIAEGLRIQGIKSEEEISRRVSDVLVRVGLLPEYAGRYPHEFSGGQRQRIGIARAIIMEPKLLIADEPVSALDVSIKAQVVNLLDDLRKEMGLAVLFISHDLSVVKYFSDRIAVMYYGKIVELADSAELFARPLHPYTKSLLSAIPLPDPDYEQRRVRTVYEPDSAHDYAQDAPSFREVFPGHWVHCHSAEYERYKAARL